MTPGVSLWLLVTLSPLGLSVSSVINHLISHSIILLALVVSTLWALCTSYMSNSSRVVFTYICSPTLRSPQPSPAA